MTDSEKGKEKLKTGDRAAHNDIERKYRTNLKDKISELRDSVPALRAIREEGADDGDEGSAQQRPPKVSKVSRHRAACSVYVCLLFSARQANGPTRVPY